MISKYTVMKFCSENISLIENYEEAVNSPEMWDCHHRIELIETGGVVNASKQDLIDWGIYWNRPADELIFLRKSYHRRLHGINMDVDTRKKCARPLSRERINKMIEGKKNMSDEAKMAYYKKLSESNKGHRVTAETRLKLSNSNRTHEVSDVYIAYRTSGGTMNWNEFQKQYWRNK